MTAVVPLLPANAVLILDNAVIHHCHENEVRAVLCARILAVPLTLGSTDPGPSFGQWSAITIPAPLFARHVAGRAAFRLDEKTHVRAPVRGHASEHPGDDPYTDH